MIAVLLTSIIVYTILNCYFIVCGPFLLGFITFLCVISVHASVHRSIGLNPQGEGEGWDEG